MFVVLYDTTKSAERWMQTKENKERKTERGFSPTQRVWMREEVRPAETCALVIYMRGSRGTPRLITTNPPSLSHHNRPFSALIMVQDEGAPRTTDFWTGGGRFRDTMDINRRRLTRVLK